MEQVLPTGTILKNITKMDILNIIVVKDGVVHENYLFFEVSRAEQLFFDKCAEFISNWDKYSSADKDSFLEDGYAEFVDGSICITWPEIMDY